MKRIIYLLILILLSLTFLGCENKSEKNIKYRIGLITTTSGINDQSFTEISWSGLKKVEKDFNNVKVSYLESKLDMDYLINAQIFVDNKYDMVVGIGFEQRDDIEEMAKVNKDVKFVLIDEAINLPNVASATFNTEESSFLAGVIAAEMSKTKKIGFIEGMFSNTLNAFGVGFIEGAKYVDKDIVVYQENLNSFTDATLAKTVAKKMINDGADVIFSGAGSAGLGSISCCVENNIYAIGVDIDQSYLAPDNMIASVVKKVDTAVYDISKGLIEDNFISGERNYNLANDGIGVVTTKLVPKEIIDKVNKVKEDIISGKIKVHSDPKDCPDFIIN